MIAGTVVIFVGVLLWVLVTVFRAARKVIVRPAPDRPAALVAFAARRLSAERPEWAQAMLAEIGYIEGSGARWRFALGCVQVALMPPRPAERSGQVLRGAVLLGVLGCAATALYAATRGPERSLDFGAGSVALLAVVLIAYAAAAFLLSWSAAPAALLARRLGLAGGLIVGLLLVLGNSPASPFGALMRGPLGPITPLAASLVVAAAAAAMAGTTRAGIAAALWTGAVASLLFCAGIMALTYGATSWFTGDPATLANLAASLAPPTSQDVATSLIRDTGETAFMGLLVGPLFGAAFGLVGAAVGVALARLPVLRHA
jgi:hypothetical protein